MQTQRIAQKSRIETAKREFLYYSFALRHVIERLNALKLTANKNLKTYKELVEEKHALTERVTDAMLVANGTCFEDQNCQLYLVNSVVLRLGGVYQQKCRLPS